MINRTSKFLVAFVCVFCFAFCGVSAKQPQQDQNFNAIIQEVLVGTSDIKIPSAFQSVAFKTVTFSETLESPRKKNEFNGVRALREFFGDEKQKFDATYIYISDDKPIVAQAFATWYVNNRKNGSVEYKLYYRKTPVIEAMKEGDLLFIGKVDSKQLFIVVTNSKSPTKDKLLASFGEKPTVDTSKKKNAYKEINNVVASQLQVEPSSFWYKVYFTPGLDCENNIISRLNSAKQIDIAVYSITNRNIVDAILAAHKRGAKVRVTTDRLQEQGKASLVKELIDAGIPVRTNNTEHKIEHNKFAIFDGKEMESGSYNWTNSASKSNSENCMFFRQVGNEFSNRYEHLWKLYGERSERNKNEVFDFRASELQERSPYGKNTAICR